MRKIFFSLLCVFVFTVLLNAKVPNEINYTGRLKSYQTPVNGTVNMIFRFYYQATDGSPVDTINALNVSVSSGIFTYTLKPEKVDWSKGDVWLELSIGGYTLAPREKLMAQPYSFYSLTAETAITAKTAENGNPPGTVIAFAGRTTPKGYLLCNGKSYPTADYPELEEVLRGLYGNQSTAGPTFIVPNFQAMFLRGAGSNTVNTSPGGTVTITAEPLGSKQSDAIRNITGKTHQFWKVGGSPSGAFDYVDTANTRPDGGSREGAGYNTFDASKVVPTSTENRPANYAVNYCIKY